MEENREEKGRKAAIKGRAYEHIVAGILIKKYRDVFLADVPLSSYDLLISIKKDREYEGEIIRAQIKTIGSKSLSFTGGTRGGVDRTYKSGVKTYIQSTKTSDVVIGIKESEKGAFDLYFVPTILIEKLGQKSISVNKIQSLKNNSDILENCKDHNHILDKCAEYGII